MSVRTTTDWTETAEEALGHPAVKGRQGELLVTKRLVEMGFMVIDHESSKEFQLKGIDLTVVDDNRSYTVDVKANYIDGFFYVYRDWITKPSNINDFYIHVNLATGDMVLYARRDMVEYFGGAVKDRITLSRNGRWPSFLREENVDHD